MSAPLSSSATVTMPISDLRRIERELDSSRDRIAALQEKYQAGAVGAIPTDNEDFARALRCALDVVSFAVANAPPEAHRGWPAASLRELGELLKAHHDDLLAPDQASLGITFIEFARECDKIERLRAQRSAAALEVLSFDVDDDDDDDDDDAEDLTLAAESVE